MSAVSDRVSESLIPWSPEAEQGVLGALMLDGGAFDRIADMVHASDFFDARHRYIFEAISAQVLAHKPADMVTVFLALREQRREDEAGGAAYINAITASVPSAANIRRYAEIVREKSLNLMLVKRTDEAMTIALDPAGAVGDKVERIAALFAGLQRTTVKGAPVSLSELLLRAVDRITDLSEGKSSPASSTGIPSLDRVLNGGLRAGKVYGIAARPSVGKSSLARFVGLALARQGVHTLLLSQEMPCDEVADCAVAQLGAIESNRIQTGQLTESDWSSMSDAIEEGARLPFYVDDQGALTIGEIRTKARMVKGLGCLIVDYLQLTSSALLKANRNEQIEEVSRGMKALAMQLGIPVIVLSQLNRDVERRADKEPQLSDLRDSGAIEQDLDVAILLWTVKEFEDGARRIVGCKVPKHRGGPKGRFALEFRASTYRWYDSTASIEPTKTEMRGGYE